VAARQVLVNAVRLVLNIVWLLLRAWLLALAYLLAGVVACLLIVTIPFGIASFRLAAFAAWPFGRTTVRAPGAGGGLGPGQPAVVPVRRLVAGAAAYGGRDRLLRDDHRDPVRCRVVQAGRGGPLPTVEAGGPDRSARDLVRGRFDDRAIVGSMTPAAACGPWRPVCWRRGKTDPLATAGEPPHRGAWHLAI
jgi:hypothetical protein